jgi:RNA polymerase sigma factor (sigma-70 family)
MDAVGQIPNVVSADRKSHVAAIVRQAGARLKRFIRARVSSDADADDLLQDVWEQLVTTLDAGPVEQVGAWLYRVARNRIIDRYRKTRPASLDAMTADATNDELAFAFPEVLLRDDNTPATEHRRALFWEQLHLALAELPQEQRQVFVWHELEGLSFQEIAALTGENQNTLLSRKRYAVLHLRARFAQLRDEFLP